MISLLTPLLAEVVQDERLRAGERRHTSGPMGASRPRYRRSAAQNRPDEPPSPDFKG